MVILLLIKVNHYFLKIFHKSLDTMRNQRILITSAAITTKGLKMEISKEILVAIGGKLWIKEDIARVYINDEVLKNLGFKIVDVARYADEFRGLGKAKLYFDCNKNCFISDTGSVRVAMKNNGFKCA